MRTFSTLVEAISEIQRDVIKGARLSFTRVQQFTNIEAPGRERVCYEYTVYGGFPETARDLVDLGARYFPFYKENRSQLVEWLESELDDRVSQHKLPRTKPLELLHPALKTTIEGEYPSYTYRERLRGAARVMAETLYWDIDTRRVYWPIFRPEDSMRAAAPTRIPCSLGYHALIRKVGLDHHLLLVYLQRSCDFDRFWLTDVWLARQFQLQILSEFRRLDKVVKSVVPGAFSHFIISLHSFDNREVY